MSNPDRPRYPSAARERRPKCCIVGFTDHKKDAPFDDPSFEIWGLNEMHRYLEPTKFTRWFEVHKRSDLDSDKQHIEALSKMPIPVYMQDHYDDIPPSVAFPKEAVEADVSPYMTSSIAWQLGLAILEGFEEIHIYGVDLAQDTEYCVGLNTRVLTADLHWLPASELAVGDRVIAFDEHAGIGTGAMKQLSVAATADVAPAGLPLAVAGDAERQHVSRQWRVATIEKADIIKRPCYRLHLADGTQLVSSVEHRWLINDGMTNRWRQTRNIVCPSPNKRNATYLVKLLDVWNECHSWDAGYLAAAFDGEGSLSQSAHHHCNGHSLRLAFAQKNNAMATKVRVALATLGFEWGEQVNGEITNFGINGGRAEIIRFLGQVRPRRLLDNFDAALLGSMQSKDKVAVTSVECLGSQPVIALKTSEGTFVAEGFASHNSEQRPCVEYLIGVARGRGIKVYVPPTSDLLKAIGQYGWGHDGSLFAQKLAERMDWLGREREQFQTGLASLKKQYDEKLAELNAAYAAKHDPALEQLKHIEGSILDCQYWKRSWSVPGDGKPGEPHIDRSKDPRTGITSSTSKQTLTNSTAVAGQFIPSDSERLKVVGKEG